MARVARAGRVDQPRPPVEIGRRQEIGHRDAEMRRIGEVFCGIDDGELYRKSMNRG